MKLNQMIEQHSHLQKDEPTIFLVRHAEKYVATNFAQDSQQLLTTQGEKDAENLGVDILEYYSSLESIKSSPMARCIQTAKAIALGLSYKNEPQILQILDADTGPYVDNNDLAKNNFIDNKDPISVFCKMLRGENVPGMHNVELASAKLLQIILDDLSKHKKPALYVTHDSTLALFTGTLMKTSNFNQENWFKYLEGISIKKLDEKYILYWNDKTYDITERCKELLNLQPNSKIQEITTPTDIDEKYSTLGQTV